MPEVCVVFTSLIGGHKTKYVWIVEADQSMRIRMEGTPRRYHEDHIAGKGINSLSHFNYVRKFNPMEIPDAKAAVENTGKTQESIGMVADESQKPKWGDRWSKEWG